MYTCRVLGFGMGLGLRRRGKNEHNYCRMWWLDSCGSPLFHFIFLKLLLLSFILIIKKWDIYLTKSIKFILTLSVSFKYRTPKIKITNSYLDNWEIVFYFVINI